MTNFEQQLAVTVHLIKTWKDHKMNLLKSKANKVLVCHCQ